MCDLNTATLTQIRAIDGVSYTQALALQLWRPYGEWAEVALIPGFDQTNVAALKAAGVVLSSINLPTTLRSFYI